MIITESPASQIAATRRQSDGMAASGPAARPMPAPKAAQQAATAVLAQANTSQQSVLKLLQ